MHIDIESVKEFYHDYEDHKIEMLAKHESRTLMPEVIPILIDEIKKRNLGEGLCEFVEANSRVLLPNEKAVLKSKITSLACPNCTEENRELIGSYLRSVKSYVLFTSVEKKAVIGCVNCNNGKIRDANLMTFVAGWWSIHGMFRTPITLVNSFLDKKKMERISDTIVDEFIDNNQGGVLLNLENPPVLQNLLFAFNTAEAGT